MSEREQAEAIGYTIGLLVIPLGLLVLGVVLGFVMAKKTEGKKFNFLPFGICWGLVGLIAIGQLAKLGDKGTGAELSQTEMQVVRVPGKPAAELPAHIDQKALRDFGNLTSKQVAANANAIGWTRTSPPMETHTESTLQVGGKTILRIDTELADFATVVQFAGVMSGMESNVICYTKKPMVFKYEGSKCEAEVNSAYASGQKVGGKQ